MNTSKQANSLDYLYENSLSENEESELQNELKNIQDKLNEGQLHFSLFTSEKWQDTNSDIEGLQLNNVNYKNRQLAFINILSSQFRNANFENANLVGANINTVNFQGANLRETDLEYAEISKCDFSGADLAYSNLRGALIKNSDFRWTDLRGADLSECIVKSCNFKDAIIDDNTILPFDKTLAKRKGMIFTSEQWTGVS